VVIVTKDNSIRDFYLSSNMETTYCT